MTSGVVVVVGAGIVGASVAYHLARSGAAVALIDRSLPGCGATGESFGWIGDATGDWPGGAQDLRPHVLSEYSSLGEVLPLDVRWTGSLAWIAPAGGRGPRPPVLGPTQRLLDEEAVRRLEPSLRVAPDSAVHSATDGAVDPVSMTETLVRAARAHGAAVLFGGTVLDVRIRAGRVSGVSTSVGELECAQVVLANGTDAPALCAPLGTRLPVTSSPAVLLRLRARAGTVRTLIAHPEFEVRGVGGGHLVATTTYGGETSSAELAERGRRIAHSLTTVFGASARIRLDSVRVGMRPMPADGAPIVGWLDGVAGAYVAVAHSGVTLAPLLGRLVAEEILRATSAPELARCRPSRFS
ncbi:NAD(P)/FAD-dependent oxidoreductase [Planctomonas psychrotolerans]|uniref:NAD(P)/FAD-dependent oxidoreductase n=1 Tax=Planctomonas psychrotolerans TaxID=2528712 RepID=UPI001239F1CF|nr:FAD-binding oxidoreductase [Planctomonas psychrotolerans]